MNQRSLKIEDSIELRLDPENQFPASKEETGHEWKLFKENFCALKRGRNVRILNHALKSYSHSKIKDSVFRHRWKLIEAIDQYAGDDPLRQWIELKFV